MHESIDLPDLTGRTILVTGASSGIGRIASLRLAEAGATVLPHGRSRERTEQVARTIGSEPLVADFARLTDVRRLADTVLSRVGRLDAILHNAGGLVTRRTLTEDGHELTFQVNYLAPFLLQRLLTDLVLKTPGSRVIVTSSAASLVGRVNTDDLDGLTGRYRAFLTYATTKLEGILFVRELSRRLAGTTTTAVAVHPGAVATSFGAGSMFPGIFYRIPIKKYLVIGCFIATAEEGAEPLLRLATMPRPESANGLYFSRHSPNGRTSPQADDPELARRLWERSEAMVKKWLG